MTLKFPKPLTHLNQKCQVCKNLRFFLQVRAWLRAELWWRGRVQRRQHLQWQQQLAPPRPGRNPFDDVIIIAVFISSRISLASPAKPAASAPIKTSLGLESNRHFTRVGTQTTLASLLKKDLSKTWIANPEPSVSPFSRRRKQHATTTSCQPAATDLDLIEMLNFKHENYIYFIYKSGKKNLDCASKVESGEENVKSIQFLVSSLEDLDPWSPANPRRQQPANLVFSSRNT